MQIIARIAYTPRPVLEANKKVPYGTFSFVKVANLGLRQIPHCTGKLLLKTTFLETNKKPSYGTFSFVAIPRLPSPENSS